LRRGTKERSANLVVVGGSPYELGLQYGRKCREPIRRGLKVGYSIIAFYNNLTRSQCITKVQPFLGPLEREVPELVEEMKGIAKGSGVSYEDIAVLNFHGRDLAGGCTMLHVGGELMKDGRSITAQTVDWTPALAPYYHIVHRQPDEGLETIQFTLAGVLGLVGRNTKGLSVFMNILLTSEPISVGIPAYLMLRLAMQQNSLSQALSVLKRKKRASPFNYMLSSPSGAYNVEASAKHFSPTEIKGRFYVHTNHCLCSPMSGEDLYVKVTGSKETLERYSTMERRMKKVHPGALGVPEVFGLFRDHDHYPDSICRHPRGNLPREGRMRTIGTVLSREGEGGIWVAYGNPCQSTPKFYPL